LFFEAVEGLFPGLGVEHQDKVLDVAVAVPGIILSIEKILYS
jgi:hypothetical protein